MANSSHAHGLAAGVVLAASALALTAVFLRAWDEPPQRKRSVRNTGYYVAVALLIGCPFLNTLYIKANQRFRT